MFDIAGIIHWFNPFVWIAKSDFAAHCEMDCDQNALAAMRGRVTVISYAAAILRLLELSSYQHRQQKIGIGVFGFILAKQRMGFI